MKTKISLSFLMILLWQINFAQITIYSSDFGGANDTARYSLTTTFDASPIQNTDTNYIWDFTQLVPNSQIMEKYNDINSTNLVYKIAFFGKANLVSKREDLSMLGVNITNSFNFFNKSTNDFKLVGYGGETSGVPIPVVFNNSDVIYKFPMTYGNIDSCTSDWEISLPGTGYLSEELHRVNEVDGWGIIKTPFGQFNSLRLKSTVFQEDSVYITNGGFGLKLPQYYTVYTWIAKNMKFPIMEATVPQMLIGQVNIKYMDIIHQFVDAEPSTASTTPNLMIYPNPAKDEVNILINTNENSTLTVSNTCGEIIFSKQYSANAKVNLPAENWARGLYFIHFTNSKQNLVKKLILQ